MIDLTTLDPVTVEQANSYIKNEFRSSMNFEDSGKDIRGQTLDVLIIENNPELRIESIASEWDTLSESYSTKTEFALEMYKNGLSSELREKIPESERDTFIQVQSKAIEEDM